VSDDPRLAFSVFAVTTPQGVPLVAVDLDGVGRVRTVAYFFNTKSEATKGLAAAVRDSPGVAKGCKVTEVPFAEALFLLYTPPFKITGLPGYYCWRFKSSQAQTADALRISGLSTLSDRSIPVFFSTNPNSLVSGAVYFELSDLERVNGGNGVGVTDLGRLVKSWPTAETSISASSPASSSSSSSSSPSPTPAAVNAAQQLVRVVTPGQRGGDTATRTTRKQWPSSTYRSADHALALEWNI
jgi:hypothetical protein